MARRPDNRQDLRFVPLLLKPTVKNIQKWQPGKYVSRRGRLMASRDPHEVSLGSRLITDAVARHFQSSIERFCSGRLVDLGCGKVPLYETYAPHVDEVICVDWPASQHGNEFLDHELDLTRRLPFVEGEFETVILSDVLEHIPEPADLCSEISRILAKGGRLLLNVPFYYPLHEEPHDYYRYTRHALERLMSNAGLEVLSIEPVGGVPEILGDILMRNVRLLPLVWRFERSIAATIEGSVRLFLSTRVGAELSKRSAQSFPLGYFLVAEKP